MKTKHILLLFIFISVAFTFGCSNNNDHETGRKKDKKSNPYYSKSSESIESERIAFFTQFLQLQPEEAKLFWPVYDKFTKQKNQLWEKHQQILYSTRPEETISDERAIEALDSINIIFNQISQLEKDFNKQVLEILPPQKVLRLQHAEHHFKRHLLKQMRDKKKVKD